MTNPKQQKLKNTSRFVKIMNRFEQRAFLIFNKVVCCISHSVGCNECFKNRVVFPISTVKLGKSWIKPNHLFYKP